MAVHPLKRCSPPRAATVSAPGRSIRWYVLPSITSVRVPSAAASWVSSSVGSERIARGVPTGMNTGVRMLPRAVCTTTQAGGSVGGLER